MSLEVAYANGQLAALVHHKLAFPAPTHPAVRNSAVNTQRPAATPSALKQPTPAVTIDPATVVQNFNAREQEETRFEPRRKLSADSICTSCRKDKHYGPCKRPIAIPLKRADFNHGMYGDDPSTGGKPSTSPHYSSATTSVSALAQAPEGRPADEQARSQFAQFLRPMRDLEMTDEPGRMTSGLDKVSSWIRTKLREGRGPTVDPYAENPTTSVPVVGRGDEGSDRIWKSFDTISDSTCIDGGAGTPIGGPAA